MNTSKHLSAYNKIVVIGLAASGKSTLTDQIAELCPDHSIYHTDDYINFGFEQSLYKLIEDLKADSNDKQVIEGVQGFRLLRKGVERQDFFPDLVILCDCDTEERTRRYQARGTGKSFTGFDKTLLKIHLDYMKSLEDLDDKFKPEFVTVNTQ